MKNLALQKEGGRAYVSCISYANYSTRINDGVNTFEGNSTAEAAWTSASEKLPQWAAVVFRFPARVDQVLVYWGRAGAYATSRSFEVQGWRNGAWERLATVEREMPEQVTKIEVGSADVEAVRIWQDVGCGAKGMPDVMKVAEVEVFGEFLEEREVAYLEIRDALTEEWEANYRTMREPVTQETLERIDNVVKTQSGTGPVGSVEIERARRNMEVATWGRTQAEKILKDANWWLKKEDAFIYEMIPPENPRAISPSYERGCPIHGGGRRCMQTNTALAYRWQCVLGGEWWFNGAKVENPGTGELVEVWDDGDGWAAPEGFPNAGTVYHFQAAWRYYVLSKLFYHPYELTIPSEEAYTGKTAIVQLSHAYALTGDKRYAHKAGVMLNRLAEVYRFYNGTVDEQRPLTRGYLVQVSWEEWPIYDCVVAYDLILDEMLEDEALLAFFRSKGDCDYNGDGKVDFEDLRYNIQHNLFGYMYEWLLRAMAIQTGDYIVREGMVLCAVGAMLDNQALIDEAVDGRYGLAVNLTNNMFRDGKWWYDAPGYAVGTTRTLLERIFSMKQLNLFEDSRLRFREAVAFARDILCDGRIPAIGDTGGADSRMRVLDPYGVCEMEEWTYIFTGDVQSRERLLALSGGDADRIRERYAGPELLFHAEEIRGEMALFVPETRVFHDSGIAILRTGENPETRAHLVLNYGKGNAGHGHRDKLSFHLITRGYDLACDLGYPTTFTHKKVDGWEKHTVSHATVCIDGESQAIGMGSLELLGRTPGMEVVCASGEKAYPGVAEVYERTMVLVDVPDSGAFVWDVFRVKGGKQHDYMFRSLSGESGENFELDLPEGLEVERQQGGTLAGRDVAFGDAPGFGYIQDVARAQCGDVWSATWRVGDETDTGIRLTMAGAPGREVITGKGEGFGFYGRSPWDACVAARSKAEETVFVAVLEPFQGSPCIRDIESVAVSGGVGVRVELVDCVEYLFRRLEDGVVCEAEVEGERVTFDGEVARITVRDAGACALQLVQGTEIRFGDKVLAGDGIASGEIESVDLEQGVVIRLKPGQVPEVGEVIVFRNPAYPCNSSYEIQKVEALEDDRFRIGLNLGLILSEGSVHSVNREAGVFATDTCMTKMEMCSGLFDGKVICVDGKPVGALETAGPDTEGFAERAYVAGIQSDAQEKVKVNLFRFIDSESALAMEAGDRFSVCDLQAGDTFELMRSVYESQTK